ncbi:phosphodiester glycosidase family protein [Galbibacter mesophilus]|uniref:phosphodiester glycosidase family protein n=1 Tax=Galbibacter mesophilus TaxID=379069 RepID=UPI00191E719B|nr:phosphodiester glycosidase family protein [Galbibacter mesophilus]MCM5661780.1 phosphodiester glycosidase family protein [Galbibacter mesophilus]
MDKNNWYLLTVFCFLLNVFFAQSQNELNWEIRTDFRDFLPSSIKIFETFSTLSDGEALHAVYAEVDSKDSNIELCTEFVGHGNAYKTPLEFANDEKTLDYVTVNGGYFSDTQSVSLIIKDGRLQTPGAFVVHGGKYPTRGAFGVDNTGKPAIKWTYNFKGDSLTYSYPEPRENLNKEPIKIEETEAEVWKVTSAIGAGPVLAVNAQPKVYAEEEHIHASLLEAKEPRTAIGYTKDDKVILLVVDGRQPGFSNGISLPGLAKIMVDLGCVRALNLDGGGSSAMVAADTLINCPSNKGNAQRPVPSVFMVKRKK